MLEEKNENEKVIVPRIWTLFLFPLFPCSPASFWFLTQFLFPLDCFIQFTCVELIKSLVPHLCLYKVTPFCSLSCWLLYCYLCQDVPLFSIICKSLCGIIFFVRAVLHQQNHNIITAHKKRRFQQRLSPCFVFPFLKVYVDMPLLPSSFELSACPVMANEVVYEPWRSVMNCLYVPNCQSALLRPWRSFPCPQHSLCWKSRFGVCVGGIHLPKKPRLSQRLPLQPPLMSPPSSTLLPLHPAGTSANPQPTICVVGLPQVCQSPSVR